MAADQFYMFLKRAQEEHRSLKAILLDPQNISKSELLAQKNRLHNATADFFLVGGSFVDEENFKGFVACLKSITHKPVVLFPGDAQQIDDEADALLYLSLLSGENYDYILGQHIASAQRLKAMDIEVVATAYLLIDGGNISAVSLKTQTKPIAQQDIERIVATAIAAEFLGFKCIYLEAGSGAMTPVNPILIKAVRAAVNIPLIVGGGLKSNQQEDAAHSAGANVVVVGNAFEKNLKSTT
ncbi:MAG: phosphoglycerol geranylgeranyltransferase [Flavobacteriaceae bacterium]|nr:phosphoglycerol geranylgeranyltransferase [Flavobacteriaceae bacterium]